LFRACLCPAQDRFCYSTLKVQQHWVEEMTRQPHRPPHLYVAGATYFITGSTYHKRWLFKTDAQKSLLRNVLKDTIVRYDVSLYAWVILSNHHHLLFKVPSEERAVVRFVKAFHGASAIELNKLDNTPGRQVWYQYRDRFPRSEAEFWSYFNYIHQNPVKHGYVEKLGDIHQTLAQYPFSSYAYYLRQYGEEFLTDVWERYPVIDHLEGDDF
jgi:putative transposase